MVSLFHLGNIYSDGQGLAGLNIACLPLTSRMDRPSDADTYGIEVTIEAAKRHMLRISAVA